MLDKNISKGNNTKRLYWGRVDNGVEVISYTQTSFCLDVLVKFYNNIVSAKESNKFTANNLKQINKIERRVLDAIDQIINQYEYWCSSLLNSSYPTNNINVLSRMLYSACVYIRIAKEKKDGNPLYETIGRVDNLTTKIADFLISIDIDAVKNLDESEEFEKYFYFHKNNWEEFSEENNFELYENCTTLIYVNALLDAANMLDKFKGKNKILILEKCRAILQWFNESYVKTVGNRIFIRGKRPAGDLEYPLYLIYYYRIAINRLFELENSI